MCDVPKPVNVQHEQMAAGQRLRCCDDQGVGDALRVIFGDPALKEEEIVETIDAGFGLNGE